MYSTRVLSARKNLVLVVPTRRYKRTIATTAEAATAAASGTSSRVSIPKWLWRTYQGNLERRPLLTKAAMASFIFFMSDSVTQYALPGKQNLKPALVPGGAMQWEWDAARALSGAGFGVVATSWLHYWWGFLEAALGRAIPVQRHRLANTMVKVAVDQLMGAPVYIYSYYVLTNFLQDLQDQRVPALQSLKENNQKASEMLWPTMMQHWKLWPIVHSFNFYFIPLHHRVLVQNTVLVGWSGYLSHLNHANNKLMTPDEEIKVTIVRRETEARMKEVKLAQVKQEKTISP